MRRRDALVMMLFVGLALSACAANPAPRAWRLPPEEVQRSPHGAWVRVEVVDPAGAGQAAPPVSGELIAMNDTEMHVLTTTGVRAVPMASVRRMTVVAHGTAPGALAAWAVAGGISTLSHGYHLLFTAPMWIVAGVATVITEHGAAMVRTESVRHFARFPQGLPPDFDARSLGSLSLPGVPPAESGPDE